MKREIKFRAWDLKHKKFYYGRDISIRGDGTIGANLDGQIILQQFTEYLDKNGKEIYDGDILRRWINSRKNIYPSNSKIHQIEVNIIYGRCNIYCKNKFKLERFEIIGNIYENANLLDNK